MAYREATWEDAKDALKRIFSSSEIQDDAADDLQSFTQDARSPIHNTRYLQLSADAGEVVDEDSTSKLVINRYLNTLADYNHPNIGPSYPTIREAVETARDSKGRGNDFKLKHAMQVSVRQDQILHKRAVKVGIRHGEYWKDKKKKRSTRIAVAQEGSSDSEDPAVNYVGDQMQIRLQEDMANLKKEQAKLRTDTKTDIQKLKEDTDKRFGIMESKVDSTHELLNKVAEGVSRLESNKSQETAITYPTPNSNTTVTADPKQYSPPNQQYGMPRRPNNPNYRTGNYKGGMSTLRRSNGVPGPLIHGILFWLQGTRSSHC